MTRRKTKHECSKMLSHRYSPFHSILKGRVFQPRILSRSVLNWSYSSSVRCRSVVSFSVNASETLANISNPVSVSLMFIFCGFQDRYIYPPNPVKQVCLSAWWDLFLYRESLPWYSPVTQVQDVYPQYPQYIVMLALYVVLCKNRHVGVSEKITCVIQIYHSFMVFILKIGLLDYFFDFHNKRCSILYSNLTDLPVNNKN